MDTPQYKYEFYPEITDKNSDHPLYKIEFHTWRDDKWTWKLYKRNFIVSKEQWENNTFKFQFSREGHPWSLIEDELFPDTCIPNKKWLLWMVDALNEKAFKDSMKEKRRAIKLELHTFGNSPAAENLVNILNQDGNSIYSSKITKHLNKSFVALKQVSRIPEIEVRHETLKLTRDNYINKTNNFNCPDTIKSHVRNVIVTKYRKYLEL